MGRPGNMLELLARRELVVARVGRGDRLVERGGVSFEVRSWVFRSWSRGTRRFALVSGQGSFVADFCSTVLVLLYCFFKEFLYCLLESNISLSFTRTKFRDSNYNLFVYYQGGTRGRTLRENIVKLGSA